MDSRQSVYYPSIDILRGFAALSVVIYHVVTFWDWQTFPTTGPLAWFRIGWLGVDLFFVISGFVIGLSALAGIDRAGTRGFRAPFWRRRLARIVPLHYLTCLVFVTLVYSKPISGDFWPNLASHVLFVHNLNPAWHGAINAPNWSLGVEMQFYALMLLLAPWVRSTRWWSIALVLTGIAWAWRYASFCFLTPGSQQHDSYLMMLTTELPGMLDEFAAGLLLARFARSQRGRAFLSSMEPHRLLILFLGVGAGLLLWLAFAIYHTHPTYWSSPTTVTFVRTPLAASFALIVLIFSSLNGPIWLYLSTPLRYLGTISYGIYLWHWPVLQLLHRTGKLSPAMGLGMTIGITLVIAAVSWHFFEKPIIGRFGRRSLPSGVPTS